ncbi:hypothetical protein V8C86DRAFT_3141077 [Haematococcus lacustris]
MAGVSPTEGPGTRQQRISALLRPNRESCVQQLALVLLGPLMLFEGQRSRGTRCFSMRLLATRDECDACGTKDIRAGKNISWHTLARATSRKARQPRRWPRPTTTSKSSWRSARTQAASKSCSLPAWSWAGAAGCWPAWSWAGAAGCWSAWSWAGAAGCWSAWSWARATGYWPAWSWARATGYWPAWSWARAAGGWPAWSWAGAAGGWARQGRVRRSVLSLRSGCSTSLTASPSEESHRVKK